MERPRWCYWSRWWWSRDIFAALAGHTGHQPSDLQLSKVRIQLQPVLAPEEMVCAQGGPSLRSLRHEPALTAHGLGPVGSELIRCCDRGLGQGGL